MKNNKPSRLGFLKRDESANITGIAKDCQREVRQRLLDLGFVNGAEIHVQNRSPLGDPIAYCLHGTLISLRKKDALHVLISCK
ncbi:MAG: ferrous iron transport protein A [Sphingobacterium sp.]|jgi:ferrous iron transport protein A|nr:ferrous iron transport protein A [Sphingobacterium sp.]